MEGYDGRANEGSLAGNYDNSGNFTPITPKPVGARAASTKIEKASFSAIPKDAQEKMAAQRPLVAAADLIQAVARHHSGFTSIALSEHAVLLYWKGDPPAAVVKVIDDARRIARVHLKSAAYSLAELERAERKLLAYLRSNPDGPFHSIKIPADGSGLIAGTTRNLAAAQAVSQNAFAQVSGYR